MRLAPRSLFSRLVLVQLTVLIAALIVSFAIHMHERGEALSQATGMQAAARIADIVTLLEPLPDAERRRIVQAFSAAPLMISLDQPPLEPGADTDRSARSALFGAMLRRYLGAERRLAVAVTEGATMRPPFAGVGPGMEPRAAGPGSGVAPSGPGTNPVMGMGMRMGGSIGVPSSAAAPGTMMGPGGMHFGGQPGMTFVAQVRLADGALVTFDSRVPAQTIDWPYRVLLSLVVLLAAVVAVSLVAVRWATRPLKALADAADALGRNIDQPPMPETGPVEVERAARAFNTMQARLVRYLRERTATLAAMSHDLKTPVSRLRLRAELLEDNELKSKIAGDLAEVESMIVDTLEFMRAGESTEPVQPVEVNALVGSVQADAQDTGGAVTVTGAAALPYPGRPQALKRCLANLVGNALQYGKSAAISIDDSPGRLSIRIRDRGPGIPESELERVFEPFHRLEASRSRDTGGTGLGLSIARQIAQLHGGALTLRNLPEGGLEAALELPRH